MEFKRKKSTRCFISISAHALLFQMRHVYVVLDMSSSMEEKDLKPDRLSCSRVVGIVIVHVFLEMFL